MPFITFGRVLFAVFFIYSGVARFVGMQATVDFITAKVTIPEMIDPYVRMVENTTGAKYPQLLAIAIGVIEILAGLMIALNLGVRFFAILMIIFVMVGTFYLNDFWNQAPSDNAATIIDALKNLSIIGALFMIAGYGKGRRVAEPAYGDM